MENEKAVMLYIYDNLNSIMSNYPVPNPVSYKHLYDTRMELGFFCVIITIKFEHKNKQILPDSTISIKASSLYNKVIKCIGREYQNEVWIF